MFGVAEFYISCNVAGCLCAILEYKLHAWLTVVVASEEDAFLL
jgi:TM2 domain-containing membrane protein YozV